MSATRKDFGKTPQGQTVELITLTNAAGGVAKIITYGARLSELLVPDKQGQVGNVVMGFDNLEQYLGNQPYFGTTVGRVCNRIAGGHFVLDGKTYRLPVNNGANTLHGGVNAIDRDVWKVALPDGDRQSVAEFTLLSPDGNNGFPGNLSITVRYSFSDKNELKIDFEATTDAATPVNLCNHSYFNLAGPGTGKRVYDHVVMLRASRYTPVNDELIPTGQIATVIGTPLDFTTPHAIGERIKQVKGGYDHNFVLDSGGKEMALAARVEEKSTGRVMQVSTTQPGVQLYTGNFLDGTLTGIGGRYEENGALCLETQHFPDSVNHPNFPSTILRPSQKYQQTTVYAFSTLP